MRQLQRLLVLALFVTNAHAQDVVNLGGVDCGMQGSGYNELEQRQNPLKNRYQFPQAQDFDTTVTLETLIGNGEQDHHKFSNKRAAAIEGYVVNVHASKGESCNCYAAGDDNNDTHIAVAATPDLDYKTQKGQCVVVEVTPRLRRIMKDRGADWSTAALRKQLIGQRVRFEGWLFNDVVHEHEARNTARANTNDNNIHRATLWELHPVTSITVLNGDAPAQQHGTFTAASEPLQYDTERRHGMSRWMIIVVCFVVLAIVFSLPGLLKKRRGSTR